MREVRASSLGLLSNLKQTDSAESRAVSGPHLSVGPLESKTGAHPGASITVGAGSGAKDSGLVFAGSVGAGACV